MYVWLVFAIGKSSVITFLSSEASDLLTLVPAEPWDLRSPHATVPGALLFPGSVSHSPDACYTFCVTKRMEGSSIEVKQSVEQSAAPGERLAWNQK